MLIVTYCVGRKLVNCLESLRFLLVLSQQFVNPVFTTGVLKILQFCNGNVSTVILSQFKISAKSNSVEVTGEHWFNIEEEIQW